MTRPATIRDLVAPYVPDIEAAMRRYVPPIEGEGAAMFGMLHYHLGWADETFRPARQPTGKRVRAALVLMSAEGLGVPRERALPAAAAVELVHEFSLIHDDIEDGDRERRHRPTLWTLWGVPQAINAGDALFAIAHRALFGLADVGVPAERVVHAAHRFSETMVALCRGQHQDMAFETRLDVTPDEYRAMIAGKTGVLLGLAAELGAIIAGLPDDDRARYRRFGERLGRAFQIQDDLLGLWGETHQTGKPVGNDIRKRKKSLPVLLALAHPGPDAESLRALYARETPLTDADVERALAIIEQTGARKAAEAEMHAAYAEAEQMLDEVAVQYGEHAVEQLRHLVRLLQHRTE
ncbi:geranylgeranyl diphosphate synthase, type I [Ardenticatena maritima]|uniref:Geranylgeranyl diphosphate synthase, type I n=1 Tax=Ardenticatena maritima TaxID=872965 RepID=A0A0M8KBU4_9CHLR|nr:polyprenyl synthetase family protein [Ardenticatena maritima]KPL90230.1 hypothetical protein SE16_00060 [Ardenticatena maritima]GAP64569.1 geranylgeranyl diphosphate synthase, type I [Ardenticatena maritima]